jgi:transposase-like protein
VFGAKEGAAGKTPVFGVLKRGRQVFLTVVSSCSKAELMPIIKGQVLESSTIYTDGWRAYDGLILNGCDHYRVFHSHDEFARGKCHINGIHSSKFILHLKECEFRYNNSDKDLFKIMTQNVIQF